MTIKEIITAFQAAAGTITGMNYRCCFLYQLTENESYPLTVLIPPDGETEYLSNVDTYDIELWILNTLPQSSTNTTSDEWDVLQGYGWEIIKYVKDTVYSGTDSMWLHRPARITFEPVQRAGNDQAPAMVFKFKLDVNSCK